MAIDGVNDGGNKYKNTTYGRKQKLTNEKNKAISEFFNPQQQTQASSLTDKEMKKMKKTTYGRKQKLIEEKNKATKKMLEEVKANTYNKLEGNIPKGKDPQLGL